MISNVNNTAATSANSKKASEHKVLTIIGNIFWVILGGLVFSVLSLAEGIVCCATLLLIPAGIQNFKLAKFFLWPMGKDVVKIKASNFKAVVNVIWAILFGWEHALFYLIVGCIFCITIIGIPFGKQYFKIARFVLTPLGYTFISKNKMADPNANADAFLSNYSPAAQTNQSANNNSLATSFKNETTKDLMEFKKLLDMGVITQEEYDNKKKQLLNL